MALATRATKKAASEAEQPFFKKPKHAPLTFSLPRKKDVDPYFGCTRGYWNDLILPNRRNNLRAPVRSIVDRTRASDRRDGKGPRGKRLIVFDSALEFFNKIAIEEQKCA